MTILYSRIEKKFDAQITEKRSTIVTLALSRSQQATNYLLRGIRLISAKF